MYATPKADPRFDLLVQPWIPCLTLDGGQVELGLLDVLGMAHELREVVDPSPVATYGLYRLLLAIVQHRLAPRSQADWIALFSAGRFPAELVDRLRADEGDCFGLFDEARPFYQVQDLGEDPSKSGKPSATPTSVGRLRPEIPTETNVNHFRHELDDRQAYCPACCAKGLVSLAPFAQSGGRGYAPSINGDPPVYTWLASGNLFETLC